MNEINLPTEFVTKLASVLGRVPGTIEALISEIDAPSEKTASEDLKKQASEITQLLVESGDISATLAEKMSEKLTFDPSGALQTVRYLITKRAKAEQSLTEKEAELNKLREVTIGGPAKIASDSGLPASRQNWCQAMLG